MFEQIYYWDEEQKNGDYLPDEFRAARVPLTVAWIMYANLDIANMEFEAFVDEKAGYRRTGRGSGLGRLRQVMKPWNGRIKRRRRRDRRS